MRGSDIQAQNSLTFVRSTCYNRVMPKSKRGYSTHISLKPGTVDILTRIKDEYREMVPGNTTWGTFLEQVALIYESVYLVPSVKAIRLNRYMYFCECPECGEQIKYPLKRMTRICWKIKCHKCGKVYIALV
jgi:predicted RNA-binding Zn-ribbon protein involved in translation (DUF1610 family)